MDWTDELAPEAMPGLRILPVAHGRVDMASAVRFALQALDPASIAVELPTTLAAAAKAAVARLPMISAVIAEEPGETAVVWVCAPGDPFAEAVRWAEERRRPVFFVDPDLPYTERHTDPVPDPWAMWTMGAGRFTTSLAESSARGRTSHADLRREDGMAHHLREAVGATGDTLALVGAAHASRVAERCRRETAAPLARTRRSSVLLRHVDPGGLTALLSDPPVAHAVYERARNDASGRPGAPRIDPELRTDDPEALERAIAKPIKLARRGPFVIAADDSGDPARRRVERHADRVEYAFGMAATVTGAGVRSVDRRALADAVFRIAAASYTAQTLQPISGWQRRAYFDFVRRMSFVQGALIGGIYEWTVAARGVGDDNLAWELFDAARAYPHQEEQAEIPTVGIDGELLDLGTRTIRFRRRFFRVRRRPVLAPVRDRADDDDPADWLRGFDDPNICSYPPEDLVIEDYGRFLKAKAVSLLRAESRRTEPFSGSMLDGVAVRETLRAMQDALAPTAVRQARIHVVELGRAPGRAGSVVAIFDEDHDDSRYPYRMTWSGEHDEESDMAFYATDPSAGIVGPGIMRATYGGFMMSMPPGRIFDIWGDPEYRAARSKSEVLLQAGIDYSEDKIVVHMAAKPPSERMRSYAARQQKRIVHIPLGSLSVDALRRVRAVHLLAGRDKRAIAPRHIW